MSAARRRGVGRIRDVNHEKTAFATGVARCAHSIDHIGLFMRDDVVRTTKAIKPSCEILFDGKFSWFANSQQL